MPTATPAAARAAGAADHPGATPASDAWAIASPKNAERRSTTKTPSRLATSPTRSPATSARCMKGYASASITGHPPRPVAVEGGGRAIEAGERVGGQDLGRRAGALQATVQAQDLVGVAEDEVELVRADQRGQPVVRHQLSRSS